MTPKILQLINQNTVDDNSGLLHQITNVLDRIEQRMNDLEHNCSGAKPSSGVVRGNDNANPSMYHSRPTWLIDVSPFSDKCDGYFQRCDWYFQMLLVFSDLNYGLKACL